MKLALSCLCENPLKPTGLTTYFAALVQETIRIDPDLEWLVFVGPHQTWHIEDSRITVCRKFPANDDLAKRLLADHFLVPLHARSFGAKALLTVGFVPLLKTLPIVMHMLTLHHQDSNNQISFFRSFYRRWMTQRGLNKSTLIITNSNFAKEQILRVNPDVESKLVVSPEGLDHTQFHPNASEQEATHFEKKYAITPGYLLWISNFYSYKQAPELLRAYSQLDPSLRNQVPLVMVGGEWEGNREKAKVLIRELGIENQVIFPGWVPDQDIPLFYRHARLFTLPSKEETFGRIVIEAMACGAPCLLNEIPVLREVAEDAAEYTPFDQVSETSQKLTELLTKPSRLQELKEKGIVHAQIFSFERMARERLKRIDSLFNREEEI